MNNWGKWGQDDELGALNYISSEKIVEATKLVKRGRVYQLAIPIRRSGVPMIPLRNQCLHLMSVDGGDYLAGAKHAGSAQTMDDYIFMATHGTTHIDALSHVACDNLLYNGFGIENVRSKGARKCGIQNVKGILSRGIMLDLPKSRGVKYLERSYKISADDLERCAAQQRIKVSTGDVLLVRTGWINVFYEDQKSFEEVSPGIGLEAAQWLIGNEISAIGSDNVAVEVIPWEKEVTPVHIELIRNHGVYMMELLNLEELSRDNVHEFLFIAAPLRIMGGVGSPLNPLAAV